MSRARLETERDCLQRRVAARRVAMKCSAAVEIGQRTAGQTLGPPESSRVAVVGDFPTLPAGTGGARRRA